MTSSKGLSSASRKPLHLCGLCEVVVGHLREQVVHYMGADVVVNLVEDAVVTVNGGQAPPEVAPLLHRCAQQLKYLRLDPVSCSLSTQEVCQCGMIAQTAGMANCDEDAHIIH